MRIFPLFFIFILSSCEWKGNGRVSLDISDTIINRAENYVQITHNIAHTDSITLLSTKIELPNDSMQRVISHVTQSDLRDSVNFLNVGMGNDIVMRHYDVDHDTLICEVIYSTLAARFIFGSITIEDGSIILHDGGSKDLSGFGRGFPYFRRTYRIYIPPGTKVKSVLFRWVERG